jgi:kumamolisin
MNSRAYKPIPGTEHKRPAGHEDIGATDSSKDITVTLILHRKAGKRPREIDDFARNAARRGERITREEFAANYGADPAQIGAVESWARASHLIVVETNVSARSVVVRGSVSAVNAAFATSLHDYKAHDETYHSHDGPAELPSEIADYVEATSGLDSRMVKAVHYSTAHVASSSADPKNTTSLTPAQVAKLYDFPAGDGAGQTIGIYEMVTRDGPPGYSKKDIADTMHGFGLQPPQPIDVAIDGTPNSGISDGETGLDITVAAAIAPKASLAVYFTGGRTQNIIHALQKMIHPGAADPKPTIISISYGWGPDDETQGGFSEQEFTQISKLFQDAANLHITVLVSSGDSGAFCESTTEAQVSYPGSDPWVTACGGTTIGNVAGATFDEYVWNDIAGTNPGATGGGVSGRFTSVPPYQSAAQVPVRLATKKPGRGVPDIAGNASPNSGYKQYITGATPNPQSVGGTSAVAPLYAALIAIINANLGTPVGFVNPTIYELAASAFRDVSAPPGPANNSFNGVSGYAATKGWNPCTGLGSVRGQALEAGLRNA